MAKFKAPAEFINENVSLLSQRQGSMYSIFLESRPTFTTYYHVNKIRSKTDRGLKTPERLNGVLSPIRYNKLINFPLYGIEQIQLQLEEEEEGLTTDYNSEAIILPNTIHPTVDDYFIINYLEKKYMFRVTKYEYDTIKSNNYYKIEFTIQSVDESFFNDIERQVVKTYYTQFDNIGTDDKVFLTAEGALVGDKIKSLYDNIAEDYLNMYFEPTREPYNTLLFMQPSQDYGGDFDWLFDQNLVHFCNKHALFYEHASTDAILFYEEPRGYFHMDYANSIYDLMEHYEPNRIDKINTHFDLEPTAVTSISYATFTADGAPSSLNIYLEDKTTQLTAVPTTNFEGVIYYQRTGNATDGYAYTRCVILPEQVNNYKQVEDLTSGEDPIKCPAGEKAIAGKKYYDKFDQNDGEYAVKVIKVQ